MIELFTFLSSVLIHLVLGFAVALALQMQGGVSCLK